MKNKIKSRKENKYGQVWITDLTISILLFSLTAVIAFKIIANSQLTDTGFETVKMDASKISEYLVNEGVPIDWDNSNVIRPGFLSDLRVNETKVLNAMNLSEINYDLTKSLLGTRNDFLVVFEKNSTNLLAFENFCSFGKPNLVYRNQTTLNETECFNITLSTENIDNIARVERLVLLNSEITRMTVYVWN